MHVALQRKSIDVHPTDDIQCNRLHPESVISASESYSEWATQVSKKATLLHVLWSDLVQIVFALSRSGNADRGDAGQFIRIREY